MVIVIGSKNISLRQKKILQEAKNSHELYFIEAISQVLRDDDITSGRENVDPQWIELFKKNRQELIKRISPEFFDVLDSLLGKFSSIDSGTFKINPSNLKVTFLLGAGASKPSPSDIPTVKELLPDLLSRARRLNRPELQNLSDFCDRSRIDNIEDLLTAAYLSEYCSRNSNVLSLIEFLLYGNKDDRQEELREERRRFSFKRSETVTSVAYLQDTLLVLFGLLSSTMLPASPNEAHKAIARFINKNPGSSIITTNYDCCMDIALLDEEMDFSYKVDFANFKEVKSENSNSLLKLHGSLNWFYCETCQTVHMIDIRKMKSGYQDVSIPYPVIAVCKECGGQRKGLIVPPLAMKFDMAPPLTPMIQKVQETLINSSLIVVVGFSFSDADLYISRMVTKALQDNREMKLIVFDPDQSVVEKIRQQFTLRILKFDPSRILGVGKDCSAILPSFLDGELNKKHSEREETFEAKTILPTHIHANEIEDIKIIT